MVQIHIFSNPDLESAIFPKFSLFLFWRLILRNKYLDTRCIHCEWGIIAYALVQWTELGSKECILTYVFIHTYIYFCMCVYLCKMISYWYLRIYDLISLILPILTCLFVTSFSDSESGWALINYIYLFVEPSTQLQ